jgi:hypothetical protein
MGSFNRTAIALARNPLGIIALFIILIYGMASIVVGSSFGRLDASTIAPMIWFLTGFPCLVLFIFFMLVTRHHTKLYAPADFRDDEFFINAIGARVSYQTNVLTDTLEAKLSQQTDELQKALDWQSTVLNATNILASQETTLHDIDIILARVRQRLIEVPDDGRAALLSGRIHRRLSDKHVEPNENLQHAIGVLTRFIELHSSNTKINDVVAAARYNRACYRMLLRAMVDDGKGDSKQILLQTGLDDLRAAIAIQPSFLQDAAQDSDFVSVRDSEDFQKIICSGTSPRHPVTTAVSNFALVRD